MKSKLLIFAILLLFGEVIGPPVTQQKKDGDGEKSENKIENEEQMGALGIEYDRYLKEVVTALESDPEFREKLEKAEEVDIRTGKIAQELEYVSHNVRTKLDELKRQELERLRQLAGQDPHHLDHNNPHTFEVEDLKKLIAKTTADLAEADRKRRQEFKEYEMQKQFEMEQRLKAAPEEQRHELEEQEQKLQQKHKKHEPLHHPGSKQQLEEVWEKQDHMDNQDFDPKTFFYLHDLDGNGVWDEEEVKALFLKELDKLYQAGAPEDDMRERREEMERMREHVFSEADTNKDGLISFQEFLQQTQKPDFEKDEGWQGLDEQQVYSPDEYTAFEQRRQQEIQRMIQQGLIPPHPNGLPPPPLSMGHQQFQQPQHFPAGQQMHPSQIPQVNAGQFHPGQVAQAQFHPGQVPQGQFHPGQAPYHPAAAQGQFQHGQVPQAQYHPGQAPQGQYHPGQVPQAQFHPQVSPQQAPLQHGQVPAQGHVNAGGPQGQATKVQPPVDPHQPQASLQPQRQQAQNAAHQQQQQQQPQEQQIKLEVPSPNQSQSSQQQPDSPNLPGNHADVAFGQHPPQPIKELHEPIDLKPNSQG